MYHTLNCTINYEAMLLSNLKNKHKQFENIFNIQLLYLNIGFKTKIECWAQFVVDFKIPG